MNKLFCFISTMPDSMALKANLASPTFTGPIQLASTQVGENVFSTTAETDTVTISGALSTDTYIVSGQFTSAIDQQDILQWEAISGKRQDGNLPAKNEKRYLVERK